MHVGICLQIDPGDPAFNPLNDFSNVRLDVINYEASLGPIFARARCERLLGDEDFYLQIDCHSRFFPDWDEILLQEYGKAIAINSRAVISHYPISIRNMDNPDYLGSIGHVNRYRQVDNRCLEKPRFTNQDARRPPAFNRHQRRHAVHGRTHQEKDRL